MVTSANEVLSLDGKLLKIAESTHKEAFARFIQNLPNEQKQWNSDILSISLKIVETDKDEYNKIGLYPKDLQIFLPQLQELSNIQKNALLVDKNMRSAKENENKIKNSLNAAKSKGDSAKSEQLQTKLNEANKVTNSLKEEAQKLRKEYIELSDKYRIEFPSQLTTMIISMCEAQKKCINQRIEFAEELINAAQNPFTFEDQEIAKLKQEQTEFEHFSGAY
ncbi:17-kDa antigen precursor, putative [Trichomonas vaginalis G3]|uniref:17-kDa antigen, putative n=1 Tax=Trichomonas vaginalis (strain ATCC PRA-98 / G3) TaxID=412133 RepID=A2F548_TRIV3|nr:17-kDa antigen precursor, putative [Trichomonas vaginalis G3]|eukprot:XP_001312871.1 17-kDa antigen precursor [Trichomonas vaginalis G3]